MIGEETTEMSIFLIAGSRFSIKKSGKNFWVLCKLSHIESWKLMMLYSSNYQIYSLFSLHSSYQKNKWSFKSYYSWTGIFLLYSNTLKYYLSWSRRQWIKALTEVITGEAIVGGIALESVVQCRARIFFCSTTPQKDC